MPAIASLRCISCTTVNGSPASRLLQGDLTDRKAVEVDGIRQLVIDQTDKALYFRAVEMHLHGRFRLPAGADVPAVAVLGAAVDHVRLAAWLLAQGFNNSLQLLAKLFGAAGNSLHLYGIDDFGGQCSHS